ncbi:MAG: hypothetical protein ABIR24_00600 [Verrucomicrobiota bacterium]
MRLKPPHVAPANRVLFFPEQHFLYCREIEKDYYDQDGTLFEPVLPQPKKESSQQPQLKTSEYSSSTKVGRRIFFSQHRRVNS